jgi:regulator of sigma E protease
MSGGSFAPTPTNVAAFILFIGILIFVHELGHFLFAKYFGIKVLKFSLGFGPPLIKFQRGETTYQVALLPLGGFVKMLGDSPVDEIPPEDRARSFHAVPVHQRALVAFAGPLFNLVFPVLCFFAYYLLGPTVVSPVVGQVAVGEPADHAGLQPGDRVLAIDGTEVWGFDHMVELVRGRAGDPLEFRIDRAGDVFAVTIEPKETPDEDMFGSPTTRGIIGVTRARTEQTRVGVDGPVAARHGFRTGDRVLKAGDRAVATFADLDLALKAHAGRRMRVVVARPEPERVGALFLAQHVRPVVLEIDVPAGARSMAELGLASAETFVRGLAPSGAAYQAGLRSGDHVLAVDGRPISLYYSFVEALARSEERPTEVRIRREGREHTLSIRSERREILHEVTGKMRPYWDSGIGLGEVPRMSATVQWHAGGRYLTEEATLTLGQALYESVSQTLQVIGSITLAVFKLFTGGIAVSTIGGPVMLFQVASLAAERGLFAYLELLALISVNLGIINLLPMPVFDGGHLVFCAIEAIKRKPVSLRAREAATIVGLVLLAVLVVLVFTNDISRLSSGFFAR